jgi:hypothetical protein
LSIDGIIICHTLEDEVREVIGQPVDVWKVHGQTAIPSSQFCGRDYVVTLEQSPRFGADTITIHNVPGFVGVRVHAGNDTSDTEGCPLLGMQVNALGIVGGTSRPAVALVKGRIAQALNLGEQVTLAISNTVVQT